MENKPSTGLDPLGLQVTSRATYATMLPGFQFETGFRYQTAFTAGFRLLFQTDNNRMNNIVSFVGLN